MEEATDPEDRKEYKSPKQLHLKISVSVLSPWYETEGSNSIEHELSLVKCVTKIRLAVRRLNKEIVQVSIFSKTIENRRTNMRHTMEGSTSKHDLSVIRGRRKVENTWGGCHRKGHTNIRQPQYFIGLL